MTGASEDDLYAALDWLVDRQARIEDRLAARHLGDGELVLYDVSSSYFEGHSCPLARLGYSRDGKRGTPQIIYGLLCDKPGRPIAVEVFSGQIHDDQTLPAQIAKLKTRFGLARVVVVCDRGIVTKANIDLLAATDGVGWITALKAPQIKRLLVSGALQPSLFDEQNLAEITSPDYPGERLVVCRNPLVGAQRTHKREQLLAATETELALIADRVTRGTLHGADEIGLAVGPAIKRYRMKKHFHVQITDTSCTFTRKTEQIAAERVTRRLLRDPHLRTRDTNSQAKISCAPTRASNRPSARSKHSKAPNSRSARSTTTSKPGSARTYSSACSPTT